MRKRPIGGRRIPPDSGGCPSRARIIGKGGLGATRGRLYPQGNGGFGPALAPKDRIREAIWSDAVDVRLSDEQQAIEDGVAKVCAQFGDDYWMACDSEARFPEEFYRAMAEGGWLGITMPEALGGGGLGVTEAAIMMHAVTKAGGGFSAASAIHINLFGPHPIVVHGTDEQKRRWLKPLIEGREKAAFGVTEPNAGLDTTSIETFARRTNEG